MFSDVSSVSLMLAAGSSICGLERCDVGLRPSSRAGVGLLALLDRDHLLRVRAARPGSASRSFCFEVGLAPRAARPRSASSIALREASRAFRSLCSRTARRSPFLTCDPSSTSICSTRPGTLAPIIGLVPRLEVALGAEQLLGLAGGHRLDQADRHLGLGADLLPARVAVIPARPEQRERHQPEDQRRTNPAPPRRRPGRPSGLLRRPGRLPSPPARRGRSSTTPGHRGASTSPRPPRRARSSPRDVRRGGSGYSLRRDIVKKVTKSPRKIQANLSCGSEP